MTKSKSNTIDKYLAILDEERRAVPQTLRETIQAAAPEAEEYISYQLPGSRLRGRPFAAFGASAKHCAFYSMSGSVVDKLAEELAGYETSKGTVRFRLDNPLPASLARKLVEARVAEIVGS